jgi:hypothetical protein
MCRAVTLRAGVRASKCERVQPLFSRAMIGPMMTSVSEDAGNNFRTVVVCDRCDRRERARAIGASERVRSMRTSACVRRVRTMR